MSLFSETPTYYASDSPTTPPCTPKRRDGVLGWLGDLLGFPKQPCYSPCDDTTTDADPSDTSPL